MRVPHAPAPIIVTFILPPAIRSGFWFIQLAHLEAPEGSNDRAVATIERFSKYTVTCRSPYRARYLDTQELLVYFWIFGNSWDVCLFQIHGQPPHTSVLRT